MFEWSKNNDALGTVNRGVPCESGLVRFVIQPVK